MFSHNPFSALSASVPPLAMQIYVIVMIALVALGTIYDMAHKRSAEFFFADWRKTTAGRRGKMFAAALATAAEASVSGEFCNARRRIAHLLGMYGFILYAVTTAIMVFAYDTPEADTPVVLPILWHVGALMVAIGGWWFWFFIRVDVTAEGHSPFRIVRADLFILLLAASTSLALFWSWLQFANNGWTNLALGLYLLATTALFASVPWSKFSHMFYKPAAAFQKHLEESGGSRGTLPMPVDKPESFGSARRQSGQY